MAIESKKPQPLQRLWLESLNKAYQMIKQSISVIPTPVQVTHDLPQFDLTNSTHLAMRKMMADVYVRYVEALANQSEEATQLYLAICRGLVRIAVRSLDDHVLNTLCTSLYIAMLGLLEERQS